jgi:hypothetical protein
MFNFRRNLFHKCIIIFIYSKFHTLIRRIKYIKRQKKLFGYIQGPAFNVTHFESSITHLLYTARNTTEHGYVSQCLGFTKKASRLQYNV